MNRKSALQIKPMDKQIQEWMIIDVILIYESPQLFYWHRLHYLPNTDIIFVNDDGLIHNSMPVQFVRLYLYFCLNTHQRYTMMKTTILYD